MNMARLGSFDTGRSGCKWEEWKFTANNCKKEVSFFILLFM